MRPADTVLRNLSVPDQRRIHIPADPFKLTILIFTIITFMYFAGEVLKPLALSVLLSFSLAPGRGSWRDQAFRGSPPLS